MTITLAELKVQARQRADMQNSQFVSDSELVGYINNSIAELHDLLCEAYGSEYFVVATGELPIVSGTAQYTLPADFYELRGVDIKLDNQDWINIKKFNFNERYKYNNFNVWEVTGLTNVRYRLVGGTLMFSPTPDQAATYQLWYVPKATRLVNDTDSLDDFNAYSEYVIVDAAIKMLQKEESDVTVLFAQKQALEKRIKEKSAQRDSAESDSISDIQADSGNI